MKISKIFGLCLGMSFLTSCILTEPDIQEVQYKYFIQNNSGHNVAVATVDYNLKKDSLVIKSGDVLRLNNNGHPIDYYSDIYFYFDDLTPLAITGDSFVNYTINVDEYLKLYIYSITEEHYKMALENEKNENE